VSESTYHTDQPVPSGTYTNTLTRVRGYVNDLVQRDDLFVVDVSVRGRKGSQVVEVFLDGDNGISVNELASVSRELGFLLDAEDVIRGKYHLNVSSPGPELVLVMPRQFPRHKGRLLELTLGSGESEETVVGTHAGMDGPDAVVLDTKSGSRTVALSDIVKARIKYPW